MDKLYQSLKIYLFHTNSFKIWKEEILYNIGIREVEPLIVILNNEYGIKIRPYTIVRAVEEPFIRLCPLYLIFYLKLP